MKIDVQFKVSDVLEALDLYDLPPEILEERDMPPTVELEAEIDDCDAFEALPDDFVDMMVDDALAEREPNARDFRDGIAALLSGDSQMGMILLCRALEEWPAAARCVEDAIRKSANTDPRQMALVA